MKALLFCGQRNVFSISLDCAKWILNWLPQRYKLNRDLYKEIKSCIKTSEGNIVILNGLILGSMTIRTHPVIIEAVERFNETGYSVEIFYGDKFYIKNFGTKREVLSIPKEDKYEKSLKQKTDTYFW